ncbi:TPA: LapA family protein, partial [Staphylococcus aureus]|nr:LapA family protein [Staphylococcus aureus]
IFLQIFFKLPLIVTAVLSILLGIFVGFIVYLIVSFYNKRKN